jgi:hypothetical protein
VSRCKDRTDDLLEDEIEIKLGLTEEVTKETRGFANGNDEEKLSAP